MRFLYSFLFYLILPFLFLRLLWRSRNAPEYRRRWAERLGFVPIRLNKCIWVHAVSMGETIAATPLIKSLQTAYPHLPILVTNMTPTGSARVKAVFGDDVFNTYIPYDVPDAIGRFLDRTNPLVCIIMETELWPNLVAECDERDIKVIVTNARLSEKSAQGYQRISLLTKNMLNHITIIAAQAQADADRFIGLGMQAARVKIVGNLKFDLELPANLAEKSESLRKQLGTERLIWIAASTHPTEEEIILNAHRLVRQKIPDALLILVPRHPERFDSVAALCSAQGFTVARRSTSSVVDANTAIYLGDTMGEMMLMYAVCDVAFVAGSFAAIGGHNMLEPAALHKPVITGPHLFNFAEISDWMIKSGGMQVVNNADGLADAVVNLLQDNSRRTTMGDDAYKVVEKNKGALKRQLDVIKNVGW